MGCLSSKLLVYDMKQQDHFLNHGDHHKVSLTSTTYGFLQLDTTESHHQHSNIIQELHHFSPPKFSISSQSPEIINAWDLMKDLIDDDVPVPSEPKKTPKKPRALAQGSPLHHPRTSPKNTKTKRFPGKENTHTAKASPPIPIDLKKNQSRSRFQGGTEAVMEGMERKCPPGGENGVVVYTTTLRGVRKTFEECNAVRRILESHQVKFSERDVSMDGGYRDELRRLWWGKTGGRVRPPVVFVRGRVVGGAEEVVRLEEEGKMVGLLWGIPKVEEGGNCGKCSGVRFVVCGGCRGSCRKMNVEGRRVRCGECNENGLVRCPLCV